MAVTGVPGALAFLRWAAAGTAGAAVAAGAAGAAWLGVVGAVAALSGVATVAAFFVISALAVAWADRRDPALTLPVAFGTYVGKVVFAGVLAFRVVNGPAPWHAVFAVSLGAGLLGWLGGHLLWFWRTPPAVVTGLPRAPARGAGPGAGPMSGGISGPVSERGALGQTTPVATHLNAG